MGDKGVFCHQVNVETPTEGFLEVEAERGITQAQQILLQGLIQRY